MTLTLNDVRMGDCFRFIDEGIKAFDGRPTVTTSCNESRPNDLMISWDALDVDDKTHVTGGCKTWWEKNGHYPVELLEHYTRSSVPVVLTRSLIRVGECFQYLGDQDRDADLKILMVADYPQWVPIPVGWRISSFAEKRGNDLLVRRIPHWGDSETWRGIPQGSVPVKTAVEASATATKLQKLLKETCNDLTGAECLRRLERAMQTESLARPRTDSPNMVSTFHEGLDQQQVVLARSVWAAKLAVLSAASKAIDDSHAVSIVVDMDLE